MSLDIGIYHWAMSRAPHSSDLVIICAEDQKKDHFTHIDTSTFSSTVLLGKAYRQVWVETGV